MAGNKKLKSIDNDYLQARQIPEYPGYFISISGRIYSIHEIKPRIHSDGYLRVCLYGTKRGKKRQGVHQLLAKAFIKNPNGYPEVRHLDGNHLNNSIENLAWGSRKMNALDMAHHGSLKGSKNPKAKLNKEQVLSIRKEYLAGKNLVDLSKKYSVSDSCIQFIVNRRNWKHI